MQRRHCRKRIQSQPFDSVEMRNLRPGGKAHRSPRAGLIKRKAFVGGAGAGDMLFRQETIGPAADDLANRLERRGRREPLRHDGGDDASRPGEGFRQMRNGRFRRNRTVRSSGADSSSVAAINASAKLMRAAKRRMLATTSRAKTGSLS